MNAPPPFAVLDFTQPLRPGATLLEASAGTGKTYTLAAIYLRLVLESGLPVQQILVTTFTIAATAELRARIRALLRKTLDGFSAGASPDALVTAVLARWGGDAEVMKTQLTQALRDFDEAAIFTIHSFCQRVLADRSFESATLLNQQLAPDEKELLRAVGLDYWRHQFYQCSDCLSAAAEVSKLKLEDLTKVLDQRLRQPAAIILPPAGPNDLEVLCRAINETFEKIRLCWPREEKELRRCFSASGNGWAIRKYAKADEVMARLDQVGHCMSVEEGDVAGHRALPFFAQSAVEKNTRVRQAPPKLEFFTLCEELAQRGARFKTAVQLDFLHWVPERLERQKARLGVHTFGDLLARVKESLHGPGGEAMVAAVRTRYRAALVDEFQDTDEVQDEIFARIFNHGEAWLFLIGDPKQAIYSFRGADVFTYLKAKDRVGPARTFTLGTNYRSAGQMVTATNALFQRAELSFVLPQVPFHPVASSGTQEGELFTGDAHEAPLRVWHWQGDPSAPIGVTRAELLHATAAEMARLLSGPARLGQRPVMPRDLAVLVHVNEHARDMQEALAEFGVPSVLMGTQSVFSTAAAGELHKLLSAVLRPANEGLLRAALLTETLGLGFSELAALSTDGAAWERWAQHFREWHAAWQSHGFITMLQRLLAEGGVPPRLLSRAGGERMLTNLLHLAELLQKAAMEGRLGPRGLVRWLSRQLADPDSAEEAQVRLERDDEAVRVVTIHQAKGLEYNIVFCPLLIRGRGPEKEIRFHEETKHALTLDLGSSDAETHRGLADREALADEVRKIYVALTRAKQRCDFVWGLHKDTDVSALAWLLHPPPEPLIATRQQLADHVQGLTEEQRATDLAALLEEGGGAIALHEMPGLEAPRYRPTRPPVESLRAREFRGHIAWDYRVSSFTSLTEQHDAELPDYDFPRPEVLAPEAEATPEGIHALPGGTRTGICLHEIFETLDFTDDGAIEPLVKSRLAAFSFATEKWSGPVSECVRRTLQVPLADGFRLNELTADARRTELEFFLPAGRLEAAPLRELLASDGLERLSFSPVEGWIKGFIDLVARHDGRYYIFDWKTNRLGDRTSAYDAPGLQAAMAAHRYPLQLHLYTLALHRYLKKRVPGYNYDTHFGGAYYLFLRGIDPAQPALGVYHRRPEASAIAALEQWLGGPTLDPF